MTYVVDKIKKVRLKWFRHVKKRHTYAPTRKYEMLTVMDLRRGKGRRAKKYWRVGLDKDMTHLQLTNMILDKRIFTSWIRVEGNYSRYVVEHYLVFLSTIIITLSYYFTSLYIRALHKYST